VLLGLLEALVCQVGADVVDKRSHCLGLRGLL
jgi:hypothetical protein